MNKTRKKEALPFVYLNVAMTADGKIAPGNRRFEPFSSARDHELLLRLRTDADAVMSGARTVDSMKINMGPGGKKFQQMRLRKGRAEYNLRVIVSGSASVDPNAEIFRHKFSPIIILATKRASNQRIERLRKLGAEVAVFGESEVDFPAALRWLRERWGVKRLLCEGGGEIYAAMFRAGLVQEVYQTICPVIFGGRNAPTLADGIGIKKIDEAILLKRKGMQRFEGELYLKWVVMKSGQGRNMNTTEWR